MIRVWFAAFALSFQLIRRRLALLAAAALLAVLAVHAAAAALQDSFSQNSHSFQGLRIGLSGAGAQAAADLAGQMEDIRSYCTFEAMEEPAARQALKDGTLSAAVIIPKGFLSSVYSGDNLSPTVLIDDSRPLEGYLARWAGECVVRVLMDAQTGIGAMLDAHTAQKKAGLHPEKSKKKITAEVNLLYIRHALSRADLLHHEEVCPTGALAPGDHYALSAAAYFCLLFGAALFPLFDEQAHYGFLQRLQSAGISLYPVRLASLTFCMLILLAVFAACAPGMDNLSGIFAGAFFAAGLTGLCAALCRHANGCALALFVLATVSLITGGGLLPPALLPAPLRALLPASPVRLLALALCPAWGYEAPDYAVPALAGSGLILWMASIFWMSRWYRKGE